MMPDVNLNIQKRIHTVFQESSAGSDKSINSYGLSKRGAGAKTIEK
jgi:hypothetical protein